MQRHAGLRSKGALSAPANYAPEPPPSPPSGPPPRPSSLRVTTGRDAQSEATANLLAPVVVNLKEQIGMQVIRADSSYSHRYPIPAGKEVASCS